MRNTRQTLQSIARLAGVSYSTVARVLSGNAKYPVSAKMREHVMKVAGEHGYSTDPFARYMRKQRSDIIGICGHMTRASSEGDASDRFNLNRRVAGIHSSIEATNYNLMVLLRDDMDPNLEMRMTKSVAYLDGLIYSYPIIRHKPFLLRLAQRLPIVIEQGEGINELCSVSVDQYGAIVAATQLLVNRGCKRIALMTHYGTEYYHNRIRLGAFQDAMKSCGLSLEEDQIITGCRGARSAFESVSRLLHKSKRIDGLIAPRDAQLAGSINAIEEASLVIGKDIRLISINETELSRHMKPGISVIRFPTEQVARESFELLLRILEGQVQEPEHILIPATIVERQSTAGDSATLGSPTHGEVTLFPDE